MRDKDDIQEFIRGEDLSKNGGARSRAEVPAMESQVPDYSADESQREQYADYFWVSVGAWYIRS